MDEASEAKPDKRKGDITMENNKLIRMDNMGIVVESLDDAISFFEEIGLKLEGRTTVEGEWAGRVTGLGSQRVEIAMMVTPMATAGLNFRDLSPRLRYQTTGMHL